jgi:endonuclease/exonuclease/phosphatase family metal-dependent hydrolase
LKASATRYQAEAYNPTKITEANVDEYELLQNKDFGKKKKICDEDSYRDSRYKAIIQSLYDKQKESADNPLVVLLQEVDDRFVDLLTTSDIWGQVTETVRIKVIRDSPQISGDTAIAVIGKSIDAYAQLDLNEAQPSLEKLDVNKARDYMSAGGFTAVSFTNITSEPITIVSVHLESKEANWNSDLEFLKNIFKKFGDKICICGGDMNCNLTHPPITTSTPAAR